MKRIIIAATMIFAASQIAFAQDDKTKVEQQNIPIEQASDQDRQKEEAKPAESENKDRQQSESQPAEQEKAAGQQNEGAVKAE